MKRDLHSGETHPFARDYSVRYNSLDLSRDGTMLVMTALSRGQQSGLAVVDLASERIVTTWPLEYAESGSAQFTPDGTGVAFVTEASGDSTILLQPLDGGHRRTLAAWPQQDVVDFRWSNDGRLFAVARGRTASHVVLVRQGQ